jgi:hypothetical protein
MHGVTRRFPKKALVPLGTLSAERLGLSARRSGELRLCQAWTRAAGPRLAARATPLGIRRGVLELRMTTTDDAWCRTLFDVIPGLAAAIAATHPGLGVESVRLISAQGKTIGEVQSIAGCAPVGVGIRSAAPDRRSTAAEQPRPLQLERVMRAYLSRSKASSPAD